MLKKFSFISCAFFLMLLLSGTGNLFAQDYLNRPEFEALVKNLESEPNLDRQRLNKLFSNVTQQKSILEAIARPAEKTKTWAEYRPIFLGQTRIDGGVEFWRTHYQTIQKASEKYEVAPEIIVAIIGVETRYGRHKGAYRVIDALATLGFDYPPRSKFFYSELEQFLLLEQYAGIDIENAKGSYAGAMGFGQFIPSSYRHYAVDFNEDGKIDLINDPVDAIGSVANYFHRHGWRQGEPVTARARLNPETLESEKLKQLLETKERKPHLKVKDFEKLGLEIRENLDGNDRARAYKLKGAQGDEYWVCLDNFYVITRYNHSHLYAMAVYQLSEMIKIEMDFNPPGK